MSRPPCVALIGAPNVGKSTLFNRLAKRRRSLVHDRPGMTRDRLTAMVSIDEREIELFDTGGVMPDAAGDIEREITRQALLAAATSDIVLLVVDGRLGSTPVDRHIMDTLRRQGTDPVLVVNKLDTPNLLEVAGEFYSLGPRDLVAISAAHGLGMDHLEEAIQERLPAVSASGVDVKESEIAVGLIGRPNVGKSSLVNRLLNEERVIVSPTPGTTRDAVDTLLNAHKRRFRLVDTAGMRRHKGAADVPESLAMNQARGTLRRVDIAVLVMDASAGMTTGDIAVAGMAAASGRAVLPLLNKWDLLDDTEHAGGALRERCAGKLGFLPDSNVLTVSAETGLRVRRILTEAIHIFEHFSAERPTSVWNKALRAAVLERRPPIVDGKPFRFYYATQTDTRPPEIDIFVNSNRAVPESYRRFLENRLRAHTGLLRTPIRLALRPRGAPPSRRRGRARA